MRGNEGRVMVSKWRGPLGKAKPWSVESGDWGLGEAQEPVRAISTGSH